MLARVVECSNNNYQYGILTVKNVSIDEVQNKIYEIKRKFYNDGFDGWCIDDVFENFPTDWEWDFVQTTYNESIEI